MFDIDTDVELARAKREAMRRADRDGRPVGVYQDARQRWRIVSQGELVPAGYRLLTTFRPRHPDR